MKPFECIEVLPHQSLLRTAREVQNYLTEVDNLAQRQSELLTAQRQESGKQGFVSGYHAGQKAGLAAVAAIDPFAGRLITKAHELLLTAVQKILADILGTKSQSNFCEAAIQQKVDAAIHALQQPDSPTWGALRELLIREVQQEESDNA